MNYSYLSDELAVQEIRKHKWIESQKKGREVGFATAAVDWINKYGESWKNYRFEHNSKEDQLTEKRLHRRFENHFPLLIRTQNTQFNSFTLNVNLIGLLCNTPIELVKNQPLKVTIHLPTAILDFDSRIERIVLPKTYSRNLCNTMFLPFNETIRNYIRTNPILR